MDRAKTWVKCGENEIFLKFRKQFIVGSTKYDYYGKNNEKNPRLLFRPVGPWKRTKTWVKSGEKEIFFKFRETFILESLRYV